jgi:HAE1 family hydrophobic/amphiphilic exporter-1
MENGMKPFEAALKGSGEIAFTILSITFSLVAVFIPVLLMSGVVGRVFREFAVTITVAILVSGFVSLTLTPMLCARILSAPKHGREAGLFSRISDFFVDGLAAGYRISLDVVLKFRFLALIGTFVTAYIAYSLYVDVPKGFFPSEDTGFLRGITEAQPDTSFREMALRQVTVSDIIAKDPAVAYVTSAVGFGGATNKGFLFVKLKEKTERDPIYKIMARMRAATTVIPGIRTLMLPVQNLEFTGGRIARAQYQYTLQSGDLDTLYKKSPEMERAMSQLPGLRDVNSDLQISNPQTRVDIDRDKAAAFGVTTDQVRTALYNAYGTRQISTIFTEADDYQVILEASEDFQNDTDALGRIRVSTPGGQLVPLDEIATMRRTVGPLQINRQAQQPAVTISFNLAPDMSLGEAITAIHDLEHKANLPASIITGFAGNAQLFQQALAGQGALLLAAVLTIYILLGVLYESYIHPITILSGLPSAGIGALLALEYFHMDLSVIAIIGILLLIGIVKKNAIMMVDFALERRREGGLDAVSAIREAALIRFRPIIMTTLAALLGSLPIAIGAGAGSELRQPLGIAIVGGLCVSQVLTLYITPVVYIYLDKVDSLLAGRRRKRPVQVEEAAAGHDAMPAPAE